MKTDFGLIIAKLGAKSFGGSFRVVCFLKHLDTKRFGPFEGKAFSGLKSLVQRPLSAFETTFLRALGDSGIQGGSRGAGNL